LLRTSLLERDIPLEYLISQLRLADQIKQPVDRYVPQEGRALGGSGYTE